MHFVLVLSLFIAGCVSPDYRFRALVREYLAAEEQAFNITEACIRGGGECHNLKDHLERVEAMRLTLEAAVGLKTPQAYTKPARKKTNPKLEAL